MDQFSSLDRLSDIPQILSKNHGVTSWFLFRKLIEIDCDYNLTPDWFSISIDDLCHLTGLLDEEVHHLLDLLEDDQWIERLNHEENVQQAKIVSPNLDDDLNAEIKQNS
jgi:hypothetical protein